MSVVNETIEVHPFLAQTPHVLNEARWCETAQSLDVSTILELLNSKLPFSFTRITHGTLERMVLAREALNCTVEEVMENDRIRPAFRRDQEALSRAMRDFYGYFPWHFARDMIRASSEAVLSPHPTYTGVSICNGLCPPSCEMEMLERHREKFKWREASLQVGLEFLTQTSNSPCSIVKEVVVSHDLRQHFLSLTANYRVIAVCPKATFGQLQNSIADVQHVELPHKLFSATAINHYHHIRSQIGNSLSSELPNLVLFEAGPLPSVLSMRSLYADQAPSTSFVDFGRALPMLGGSIAGSYGRRNWLSESGGIRNPWSNKKHPDSCPWYHEFCGM